MLLYDVDVVEILDNLRPVEQETGSGGEDVPKYAEFTSESKATSASLSLVSRLFRRTALPLLFESLTLRSTSAEKTPAYVCRFAGP